MAHQLKISDFLPVGGSYHFAKTTFSGKCPRGQHSHDFAEVFWVTEGQGIHIINGCEEHLSEGDVVFIRPEDEHGFTTVPGKSWTIANLAFEFEILDELKKKIPEAVREHFGQSHCLSRENRAELERQVLQLLDQRESRFSLERFLMNLAYMLLPRPETGVSATYPDWLRKGLGELRKQEVMQSGLAAFVNACSRSQEHVNRECRKHLGMTPTNVINEARLRYAETQLISTDKSIKEICWECGFKSSAYFHKLFKSVYGQSPLIYRKTQQSIFRG